MQVNDLQCNYVYSSFVKTFYLTQHLVIYYFVTDHTQIQWHKTTISYSLPFCGMAEAQLDGSSARTLERMGLEQPSQLHASSHVASSLCLRSWTFFIMASFQERVIQAGKITNCDLLKCSVTSATFQWSEKLQSQPRLSRRGNRQQECQVRQGHFYFTTRMVFS